MDDKIKIAALDLAIKSLAGNILVGRKEILERAIGFERYLRSAPFTEEPETPAE